LRAVEASVLLDSTLETSGVASWEGEADVEVGIMVPGVEMAVIVLPEVLRSTGAAKSKGKM